MQNKHFNLNPHLSVDCVIFGFDGERLKVLLVKKEERNNSASSVKFKLPGDLIIKMECLEAAAARVLNELTGLNHIFLKQLSVFGNPERLSNPEDKNWLESTSGLEISRVVTTAYYSLIRIDKSKKENAINNNASWHDVTELPELIFDHSDIIIKGIDILRKEIRFEPICFELLPGKFTIRQIQTLYEVIVGTELDNRNFRKKLLKAPYIEALNEKEVGVAHKPAMYYRFNREEYNESRTEQLYYNF